MKQLVIIEKTKPRKPRPKPPEPVIVTSAETETPAPPPQEPGVHIEQVAASQPDAAPEPQRQMQAEQPVMLTPVTEIPSMPPESMTEVSSTEEILGKVMAKRGKEHFIDALNKVGAEMFISPRYLYVAHNESARHILYTASKIEPVHTRILLDALNLPDETILYQKADAIDAEWKQQLGPYAIKDFVQSAKNLLRKHKLRMDIETPGPLLGSDGMLVSHRTRRDILSALNEPKDMTAQTLIEKERASRISGSSTERATRDISGPQTAR
jgi:hypothetical protein